MTWMLDATTGGTKPVMQYIRELEDKVRQLREEVRQLQRPQLRFNIGIFLFGLGAGAAGYAAVWYFVQHR